MLTSGAGARATFTFNGTVARWIAYRDSGSGIANVYVDGMLQQQVDAYVQGSQAQTVMFTTPNLEPGTHTLTIEVSGSRNPSAQSNWIWVDAFDALVSRN